VVCITVTEEMPVEEMHRRMDAMTKGGTTSQEAGGGSGSRGFHTVTPYMIALRRGCDCLLLRSRYLAPEETFARVGSAGGIHGEARIGDTIGDDGRWDSGQGVQREA